MVMGNITKSTRWMIIGCIILLMTAFIGLLPFFYDEKIPDVKDEQVSDYKEIEYNGKYYKYNSSIVSFLFIGTDKGSDESLKNGQADTLFLVLLDRESKKISCIPISRDTMTEIRVFDLEGNELGWHEQQLSLAYAYGKTSANGCMYTLQAVSRMLHNIPINYYVSVDVSDLTFIQSLIGSVEVEVVDDALKSIESTWSKGSKVIIDDTNVELFLRSRDTAEAFSNEERMERQIAYLEAFRNKFMSLDTQAQEVLLKNLYEKVNSAETNISLQDLQTYGNMFANFTYHQSNMYKLKGNYYSDLHDEFILDKNQLSEMLVKVFYKEGY